MRKTYINDYIAKKKNNNKHQKGGLVIHVWLATMLTAGGVKITEKAIDYISDKLQGKGVDINKIKTSSDRNKF